MTYGFRDLSLRQRVHVQNIQERLAIDWLLSDSHSRRFPGCNIPPSFCGTFNGFITYAHTTTTERQNDRNQRRRSCNPFELTVRDIPCASRSAEEHLAFHFELTRSCTPAQADIEGRPCN